jgi:hypothetical protein
MLPQAPTISSGIRQLIWLATGPRADLISASFDRCFRCRRRWLDQNDRGRTPPPGLAAQKGLH